ncbi:hypothetical protein HK102_013265 [Quaeritorhiza haematococci]|nr:hypothetical protein HK102_013265 [Quaeritorhiza haematococci]
MSGLFGIPLPLLTDSYKETHYLLYPDAQKMVAYGEFRAGFNKDTTDTRLIFYGIRHVIEQYVAKKWTVQDVILAEDFFKNHGAGSSSFPFPKELFLKFIRENDGYFPVKIEALSEGTVVHPHTPVYVITAEKEYARLVTYLETLLTHVWYPSTVATLSRRARDIIEQNYEETVDDDGLWTLNSRLHDFGFRGCTSVEQSIIGGCAHLLNFVGTDTLSAAYYAQYHLNKGRPVAESIPATEHSVMTAYPTEREALAQLLNSCGEGACACVMDSYDYTRALEEVLPSVKSLKTSKGGFLVLRPDSGDPVEVVLMALRAADKTFGSSTNKKGFKVLNGVGVIQGDGINVDTIRAILKAATKEGYSAQNIAFGMGAGLLQKVNRDTMSFATKLSKIVHADGSERDVMKAPKTDPSKWSLPGELVVIRDEQQIPTIFPKETIDLEVLKSNMLHVVYDHGRSTSSSTSVWDDFSTIRERVQREWKQTPKVADAVSAALREKMKRVSEKIQKQGTGITNGAANGTANGAVHDS